MMMNERVEIGRGDGVAAGVVDEKLVMLHRTLKRIAKARAHLDLQEAEALREAQRLQLWKQFGHTSLADYMVQELGYSSHRVAEDRLRLANALPQLPMIEKAIQNGELNMSQARELTRVATKETEQAWIDKTKEMNVRQVEQAVSGHAKGDLPEDPRREACAEDDVAERSAGNRGAVSESAAGDGQGARRAARRGCRDGGAVQSVHVRNSDKRCDFSSSWV